MQKIGAILLERLGENGRVHADLLWTVACLADRMDLANSLLHLFLQLSPGKRFTVRA
jgi:hypothetical protein